MKLSSYLLFPVIALASACGGSGSSESDAAPTVANNAVQSPPIPDDARIANLVYDTGYSVPDGFFVDERADTERSYTVHHVLDESSSFELCTDDYAEATAWEQADNASRSVRGYYVESYDNERYFEFVRELSYDNDVGNVDDLTSPGFARVFKCSNTNRNGVDRLQLNGYAGILSTHPLDGDSVRVFAEYLWQFTFFPVSRKKVIDSYGTQSESTIVRTLVLAFASTQGTDRCDRIEVAKWRFSASRYSGEVYKEFVVVRQFEAKIDNGVAVIC